MKVSDLLKESLGVIDNMDGDPVARKLYERENPSLRLLLSEEPQVLSEAKKITVRDLEIVLGKKKSADPDELQKLADVLNRGARGDQGVSKVLRMADRVLGGFGVEELSPEYGTVIALYVNMGDTYASTVLYDTESGEFMVTTWGDFFEEWERDVRESASYGESEEDILEAKGKRRKRALKKVGGVHKMVRLKKTGASTLAKNRIKSKTAKSKLQRKRKERKNLRSAQFKKRARSLARASKRFGKKVSGTAAKAIGKGMSVSDERLESNSLISRINQELNESSGSGYVYRDASTSPRQTVTFGSPIMPYLDNLSLSEELAVKLAEMSRDRVVADKLVEFAEKCGSIVSGIQSGGFTEDGLEYIRGTAFEASEIVTTALRQFEELGYFNNPISEARWLQKESSNLQSWSQSGGSPKTPEDRKSAAFIQKMLDKVGLWRGRRWEYFTSSQEGVDPSARVGYSTFSDGRGDEELWIHGIKQGYFSIGIQVYGNEAGEVSITHGDGNKYDSFPNLNAAQRWLAR